MLTCIRCGAEYQPRPGKGRQSPYCGEVCREAASAERRRHRFQLRYHTYDTYKGVCITCGGKGRHFDP